MERTVDYMWKSCLTDAGGNKPLFVISVIGDSKSVIPSTWEKSNFQISLIDAARGADDCWIFHKDGNGKLSQAVKTSVESYWEVRKQGPTGKTLNIFSRKRGNNGKITLFGMQPKKMNNLDPDVTLVREDPHKRFKIRKTGYIDIYTEFLKKIAQERVTILNHNKKGLKIMTAVIVLVAEGDIDTIHHVDKILQNGMPVIIIKGSGKASDVIAEYLEHEGEILKSDAPLLLGIYANPDALENFAANMKSIKAMKHLISIYNVQDPNRGSLSEVATDIILRSWTVMSLGKSKSRRQVASPLLIFDDLTTSLSEDSLRVSKESTSSFRDMLPVPGSQLQNVDGSTINSIRIGTQSGTGVLEQIGGTKWHIASSFSLYFYVAYQIIQQNLLKDKTTKRILINDLFGKAIAADKVTYVAVLLHEHNAELELSQLTKLYTDTVQCRQCPKRGRCQHLYSVLKSVSEANFLFKLDPEKCVKAGRETCAALLHYPKGIQDLTTQKVSYQDLLIWALLANRPKLAEIFWKATENQLLTALLAYGVLKKMATIAKRKADQSVHQELLEHAKIFEKRSQDMQRELYKEYPDEAMELMTTNACVWDINTNPLKCAHYNDMYEFIADPCSQRCLKKIWYNNLGTDIITALENGFVFGKIGGRYAFSRMLSAPFTKYLVNYVVFFIAVVIYSAFVLTNLEDKDTVAFEYFVYIWMASDIVENYLVPMVKRKTTLKRFQLSTRRADVWYWFKRYINNFWNVLDTLFYLLTFIAIGLRFHHIKWARRVYSFSLFLVYMRFLHFTLIFRKIGVYVILIKEMMKDLARFIVIIIVFMLAVGVMYHLNKWPDHKKMWSSDAEKWRIWQIVYLPYWQIYGEAYLQSVVGRSASQSCCNYMGYEGYSYYYSKCYADIDRCRESDDGILYVIAAFYMLLSNLLLVNLVIALFSSRFEKVRTNSEKIWRYMRYEYIMDYRISVPAFLNIVLRPTMLLY